MLTINSSQEEEEKQKEGGDINPSMKTYSELQTKILLQKCTQTWGTFVKAFENKKKTKRWGRAHWKYSTVVCRNWNVKGCMTFSTLR
jgi:hypothetical protein